MNKFSLAEYDDTIREVLNSGGAFRIYPRGTSMLPLLREGIDSVLLEKPDGTKKAFVLTLGDLTDDERQIILDGCLINYYNS